jgi:hypothetical protein
MEQVKMEFFLNEPELLIKQIDNVAATSSVYKNRSGFLAKAAMHELKLSV